MRRRVEQRLLDNPVQREWLLTTIARECDLNVGINRHRDCDRSLVGTDQLVESTRKTDRLNWRRQSSAERPHTLTTEPLQIDNNLAHRLGVLQRRCIRQTRQAQRRPQQLALEIVMQDRRNLSTHPLIGLDDLRALMFELINLLP